jgi:hypothetical protein
VCWRMVERREPHVLLCIGVDKCGIALKDGIESMKTQSQKMRIEASGRPFVNWVQKVDQVL